MEEETKSCESGSDESDVEEMGNGKSGRDSNAMLDTWLAELDSLTTDMDTKPVDPFRFSQATLEDTQEDELNAILGELSALQMSLDQEIITKQPTYQQPNLLQVPGSETKPNGGSSDNGGRTESPDNDSGFSDNASLLSSGSSLSASGSSSGSSTTSCIKNLPPSVLRPNEDEKAEKIREALAKMRAASVTRLYVKAFSPDGSSKALMVEESMSCGRVLALLADKNHVPLSPKWALVEHIPHLHMERIYEDHENMVENLLMWTRDSKNKIYFVERDEKYDMFVNPQRYFLESHGTPSMDEHTKNSLIDEFFNQGVGVPEVESVLYLKAEGKKAWKKFMFVLRASGIYYSPKGRMHANSKDLVCLATIDPNQQTYQGIGWKKKFKAPTEFGFVLKPARLQVKSHRHMKYLCAEDEETLRLWIAGLRIAKYKRQLWDNYRSLLEDIAHEDLDRFGRSVSLASMPIQINTKDHDLPVGLMRQLQIDERAIAHISNNNNQNNNMPPRIENSIGQHVSQINFHPSPQTPNGSIREEGFESDCPVGGTIKRKPSTVLQPKIPLTINTRSIVGDLYVNDVNSVGLNHTLQRRRSSSGNSGSGSTASSNSSLSSINSQPGTIIQSVQLNNSNNTNVVHSQHQQRHNILQGKPPLSTPRKPTPLLEESPESLDYDLLPPPPPELLSENPIIMMSTTNFLPPPPPPIIDLQAPYVNAHCNNYSGSLKMKSNNNHNTSSHSPVSSLGNSIGREKKKGVSFASELTQRLQSRNNHLNNVIPTNNNCDNNNAVLHNHNYQNASNQMPVSQIQNPKVPMSSLNSVSVSSRGGGSNDNNPKKLEDPPQDFLADLQRVMQKKWQVAQKCNADTFDPHEILGFRIPDPSSPACPLNGGEDPIDGPSCVAPGGGVTETVKVSNGETQVTEHSLNNVRAWVSQHYGSNADELAPLQMQQIPPQIGATIVNSQQQHHQSIISQQQQQQLPQPPPPQQTQKPVPPMRTRASDTVTITTNCGLPPPPPLQIQVQKHHVDTTMMNNMSRNNLMMTNNGGNHNDVSRQCPPGQPTQQQQPPGIVIYENFQAKKNSQNNLMTGQYVQVRNKKPPPPIPRRAESTHLSHLSTSIVYN